MTATETCTFRAISVRAAVGYLENLGGERVSDGHVEGEGWRARLSEEKVRIGPSMQLNEITVEFECEDHETLDRLVEQFSQKAMRAGG